MPIQSENASPIECNGKLFHCINTKQFRRCFDINRNGTTQTVNNAIETCKGPTFCDNNLQYECTSLVEPTTTTARTAPTMENPGKQNEHTTLSTLLLIQLKHLM